MATPKNKPALGRGLSNLLGGERQETLSISQPQGGSIAEIALSQIETNPHQPRREFSEEKLRELATSIKTLGLIQPITIQSQGNGRYTLVSGERRYRAAKLAGLNALPAYIKATPENQVLELALVENIQREDLNAIEIALAYNTILNKQGITHEELATRLGKSRSNVTNYLRLLRLPAEIQLGLTTGLLEMGHARALLQVSDTERQLELYSLIQSEHLSVRQVEELAKALQSSAVEIPSQPRNTTPSSTTRRDEFQILEHHLGQVFSTKVSLQCNTKGKGKITIPFANEEELEHIIQMLERVQR